MKKEKCIISQSAYWTISKILVHTLMIDATFLLADLLSKYEWFDATNKLDRDGFFFNSQEQIEKDTTITPHRQVKALKVLKNLKLIETTNSSNPPITRFKINIKKINELVILLQNEG